MKDRLEDDPKVSEIYVIVMDLGFLGLALGEKRFFDSLAGS